MSNAPQRMKLMYEQVTNKLLLQLAILSYFKLQVLHSYKYFTFRYVSNFLLLKSDVFASNLSAHACKNKLKILASLGKTENK